MSEKTPGRTAYEAFQRAFPDEDWGPWERIIRDGNHAGWEDIANAAIAAVVNPDAEDYDLTAELLEARRERDQLREVLRRIALGNAGDPSVAADKALVASRQRAGIGGGQ